MPSHKIYTLIELQEALDDLYYDIEHDCQNCQDPDCMGYIWLLEQEVKQFYERGVQLVQINNGPTFIHSFPTTTQGQLIFSVRYPPCSQLCPGSRRCSIYKNRPFVCHLYPLGFETKADSTIVWTIYRDCLYIRKMEERGLLSNFKQQARNIINNLSPRLLKEIMETYRAVNAISHFPDGENNYSSLQEAHYVKM